VDDALGVDIGEARRYPDGDVEALRQTEAVVVDLMG